MGRSSSRISWMMGKGKQCWTSFYSARRANTERVYWKIEWEHQKRIVKCIHISLPGWCKGESRGMDDGLQLPSTTSSIELQISCRFITGNLRTKLYFWMVWKQRSLQLMGRWASSLVHFTLKHINKKAPSFDELSQNTLDSIFVINVLLFK